MTQQESKDHWTHQAYSTSASFVPQLTSKIIEWLNPLPSDIILDLGCGDGVLTAQIKQNCSAVTGYDASANLIQAARDSYGAIANLDWHVQDCRYFEHLPATLLKPGKYTKVFSNAALHWILRDSSTRLSVLRGAANALQPGGTFVFEMGGAGNVAEVHAALLAALVHHGCSIQAARDASPWFFPSEALMHNLLEQAGFAVEKSELEHRPTKLPAVEKTDGGGGGGLEGWVRLMGAAFLDVVGEEGTKEREGVVKEVCQVLESVMTHEEDGSVWMGYVRLRVLARKR